MERIPGERLDMAWLSLTEDQKTNLSSKLRASIQELRNLPSPAGYCSLGNRPLQDSVFWTADDRSSITKPFQTEHELNEAMIAKYIYNKPTKTKHHMYKKAFSSVLRNHLPVFTHGDIQRKNILIRALPKSQSTDKMDTDQYEISLLDWETAGWYPSYWEFGRALFACGYWGDDWGLHVTEFLDPFWNEWALTQMLLLELWS